ncbi:MAG: TolC family protein [Lachnospiraceae bacterium]|nr:TolC family protein [Lachnospiraceae bacterium]
MRKWKQAVSLAAAGAMFFAMPNASLASSPEFSRTEEEWARLRDDVLEYDEIEDLIAEYNATVQTNQLDLNEFKKKYGDTKDDVSAKYRDMANEIYASVDYPDSDDPMYGMVVNSMLMAEIQAKNMMQQADDNLDDSEIIYLNYKQAEKTLVTVAQSNMINYAKGQLQLRQAEVALLQAQSAMASTNTRRANGLATQTEVLSAQEALLTAQRSVESARSGMENVRQKLLVMLGWRFDARPEIRPIPKADLSRIGGMNPQTDKEQAIENNYTRKVNKKKLANAASDNVILSLEKTIADNEQKIGSSLVTNYQNVLTAKLAYDQAVAELDVESRNLHSLEVNFQQGNASRMQMENQQYVVQNKQLAVEIADLNLFQTMETYDWAVNGLAGTS